MAKKPLTLPSASEALKGRPTPLEVAPRHLVTGAPMRGPWPGMQQIAFGMGCFWGAERKLWQVPGVTCTAAAYAGGHTPNPTYEEVCSGRTGHAEVVWVVFDPARARLDDLLRVFWEGHDPTQGMRQGNDVGTQYRSIILTFDEAHRRAAIASRDAYQQRLTAAGFGAVTTTIEAGGEVYYAEDVHQQYLHKNPGGYCGLGGTGVSCPVGVGA